MKLSRKEKIKNYVRDYRKRHKEEGLCINCHRPVLEENPTTKELYTRCRKHRIMLSQERKGNKRR